MEKAAMQKSYISFTVSSYGYLTIYESNVIGVLL